MPSAQYPLPGYGGQAPLRAFAQCHGHTDAAHPRLSGRKLPTSGWVDPCSGSPYSLFWKGEDRMKLYKSEASRTFPKAEDCLSEQKLLEPRAYGCCDQPEES